VICVTRTLLISIEERMRDAHHVIDEVILNELNEEKKK